jgi:hypothetical protein
MKTDSMACTVYLAATNPAFRYALAVDLETALADWHLHLSLAEMEALMVLRPLGHLLPRQIEAHLR